MARALPGAAGDGRRQDILAAALAAFDELGYATATIEDIRRRSGASVGSIYHHFGSKAAIAAALYLGGLAHYQDGLLAQMRRARDGRTLIRGVVQFHLGWAREHPAWARFLLSMRQADAVAAMELRIRERNEAFFAAMTAIVAPFVERGQIAPLPAQVLVALVHGPAHEFLRLWLAERAEVPLERAATLLADGAWHAVRGRPRAVRARKTGT